MSIKLSNFIDGKYVAPSSGKYLDNYEPASGTVYSLVPDSEEVSNSARYYLSFLIIRSSLVNNLYAFYQILAFLYTFQYN